MSGERLRTKKSEGETAMENGLHSHSIHLSPSSPLNSWPRIFRHEFFVTAYEEFPRPVATGEGYTDPCYLFII